MNSNWSYSPETPNLGQIRRFLEPCDLEIWLITLKNNKAPLLSIIKLYVSFHHHMWIQTGVTVRKRLSWVVTSVTLTFHLWPWPFAWMSLLSLVITSENFMMIRWWEHSQKGVTDGWTDRRTDGRTGPFIELLGRSLKKFGAFVRRVNSWPFFYPKAPSYDDCWQNKLHSIYFKFCILGHMCYWIVTRRIVFQCNWLFSDSVIHPTRRPIKYLSHILV